MGSEKWVDDVAGGLRAGAGAAPPPTPPPPRRSPATSTATPLHRYPALLCLWAASARLSRHFLQPSRPPLSEGSPVLTRPSPAVDRERGSLLSASLGSAEARRGRETEQICLLRNAMLRRPPPPQPTAGWREGRGVAVGDANFFNEVFSR
ncbi:hypothetical protein SKAU_G00203100 [Synaphobranchus kaupii]|uniref:Uncharacterized protein n=1 Tax=Synaphobranchus kaupii TaxID=118154 RepID=A0A9Q1FFZ4_SYNKA|nr:hypothetical protein SKAU_G00203100 [Synaphobranchus kaupii]